ncbi:glycoside hydrolase family 3 C-terminal domain-containing protein [Marinomonas sp. IMCC 4694]|uniref:glycoside hydrolase family 3 C-terminal domain-containing protein n=1 Tax=Marinomonas sp. IMCC 4694 TaxID=2605432 RepID=UPI0011E71523|nr:glycoside hydrolase family 3 C-terminal domain-containing protein [Marinomonas sp. IMCC 4694]TYL46969.1 beta-glucosidase [Marinomonas sp. IMCC 4694]
MSNMNIEDMIKNMTLSEKVALLSGQDFWSIGALERLGLGELRMTDGPNGARGAGSLVGGVKSACFPCGIALGATWNPSLLKEIGSAIADEVKSKGAHVSLAPTVNLHRTTRNGRNFECYSEDAVLTAELAVPYIQGLQEKRISATIKHFVGNESEIERTSMSSEIDEKTLREHHLYPFEMAVKKAGTWGVMSSYNRLNGTYTAENSWLLNTVLRDQWQYDGIVMSDWFGSKTTAPTVNAGLNLEMPGPTRDRGDKLIAAVNAGEVSQEQIDALVTGVLTLMERTGVLHNPTPRHEVADNRPEHRALIRRAGAEGTVLLKNTGILPLARSQSIAVMGANAKTAQIMGGGSAQLNPHYRVSPYDGLVNALGEAHIRYALGSQNRRFEPLIKEGDFTVEYFANRDLAGEAVYTESLTELQVFLLENIAAGKVDGAHFSLRISGSVTVDDTATYFLGGFCAGWMKVHVNGKETLNLWGEQWQKGSTFFEEGCNEKTAAIELNAGQTIDIVVEFAVKPSDNLTLSGLHVGLGIHTTDADIEQAVALAKQADVAVLCVGRNGEWDTEGSDLPHMNLPDRQDELVAAVAAVNPNTVVVLQTGGPIAMPWLPNVAAVMQAWYPGQEVGNAIADVLLGDVDPSGRLPQTFPVNESNVPFLDGNADTYPGEKGKVVYREADLFGYRYYDHANVAPLFEFGYGLSYAAFALNDVEVREQDGVTQCCFTLHNTSDRDGVCVPQLYVTVPSARQGTKALRQFGKYALAAGESRRVALALTERDFAVYDLDKSAWRVDAGEYLLTLGLSSRQSLNTLSVEREHTVLLPV